jgi:hypothetical protein
MGLINEILLNFYTKYLNHAGQFIMCTKDLDH